MIAKVFDYIQKYRMIEKGDTIVLGVSGGADSVCLLFVLLKIREKLPFQLAVVHVNHGIREDAGEDAVFVRGLCKEYDLPFYLTQVRIKEYAESVGISEEEAGRKVRYQAFEEALQKEQDLRGKRGGKSAGKIAVAHNSNDRAETMLFHLFRGTGLTGLTGINPVNGRIIRPLLCLERREIEAWLTEQKIPYRTDSTNAQDIYTRNRIRHHILPFAEEKICNGAVSHMNRTAENIAEAEEFIKRQTRLLMDKCVSCENQEEGRMIRIDIQKLLREDSYLQGRVLLSCVEDMANTRKDITAAHINSIRKLFQGREGGEIHLPYGLVVYREYNLGMIVKGEREKKSGEYPCYQVPASGTIRIPGLGNVEIAVFPCEKTENIPRKTYTKWFDYDKITKSIVFRVRQSGDYLTINSRMARKSLQDYFVNEKIPKTERDSLYVLTEDSHVLWVPGYRISEYYKVTEHTLNILQIKINRDLT